MNIPVWGILAIALLAGAVLFIPWPEPCRRAERLIRAWRSGSEQEETASGPPQLES